MPYFNVKLEITVDVEADDKSEALYKAVKVFMLNKKEEFTCKTKIREIDSCKWP